MIFDVSNDSTDIIIKYPNLDLLALLHDEDCFIRDNFLCFKADNMKNDFTIFKFKINRKDHKYRLNKDPIFVQGLFKILSRVNTKFYYKIVPNFSSMPLTQDNISSFVSTFLKVSPLYTERYLESEIFSDSNTPIAEIREDGSYLIYRRQFFFATSEYNNIKNLIEVSDDKLSFRCKNEIDTNSIKDFVNTINADYRTRVYYYYNEKINGCDYFSPNTNDGKELYTQGFVSHKPLFDNFQNFLKYYYDLEKIQFTIKDI